MNLNYENMRLQGKENIRLAEQNMGALMKLRAEFSKRKTFKDVRIALALHVTKETAVLVRTLRDGGAKVAITSCNPLSTQDDVVAALQHEGVEVYGYKGESRTDYYKFLRRVLAIKPHITIDDGCDLVNLLHSSEKNICAILLADVRKLPLALSGLRPCKKLGR